MTAPEQADAVFKGGQFRDTFLSARDYDFFALVFAVLDFVSKTMTMGRKYSEPISVNRHLASRGT